MMPKAASVVDLHVTEVHSGDSELKKVSFDGLTVNKKWPIKAIRVVPRKPSSLYYRDWKVLLILL